MIIVLNEMLKLAMEIITDAISGIANKSILQKQKRLLRMLKSIPKGPREAALSKVLCHACDCMKENGIPLKYQCKEDFMSAYGESKVFKDIDDDELTKLTKSANSMSTLFLFLPANNRKELALSVVSTFVGEYKRKLLQFTKLE